LVFFFFFNNEKVYLYFHFGLFSSMDLSFYELQDFLQPGI